MRTLTVINTLLCFFSVVQVARAIYLSYLFGFRARTRSITYMLALDKRLFERIARWSLWSLLGVDFGLLAQFVNRLADGFPPYLSVFTMITSTLLTLALFFISQVALISYDDKLLNWLLKRLQDKKEAAK